MIRIRKFTETDKKRIWEISRFVTSTGGTFNSSPDATRDKMLASWRGAEKRIYAAVSETKPPLHLRQSETANLLSNENKLAVFETAR